MEDGILGPPLSLSLLPSLLITCSEQVINRFQKDYLQSRDDQLHMGRQITREQQASVWRGINREVQTLEESLTAGLEGKTCLWAEENLGGPLVRVSARTWRHPRVTFLGLLLRGAQCIVGATHRVPVVASP